MQARVRPVQMARLLLGVLAEPPSPALPPSPILTTLGPFQRLGVEHHVGQGHLGLCLSLWGEEAEGSAKGKGIRSSALGAAINKLTGPSCSTGDPHKSRESGLDLFTLAHTFQKCLLEAADRMSNRQPPSRTGTSLPCSPQPAALLCGRAYPQG